ncbi:MAG: hypothetical protein K2X93_16460 [Candidatus Obscuribacterales bacterium]|nr:hypothetical protein [Candidatus Obscuribacterales bacterium]
MRDSKIKLRRMLTVTLCMMVSGVQNALAADWQRLDVQFDSSSTRATSPLLLAQRSELDFDFDERETSKKRRIKEPPPSLEEVYIPKKPTKKSRKKSDDLYDGAAEPSEKRAPANSPERSSEERSEEGATTRPGERSSKRSSKRVPKKSSEPSSEPPIEPPIEPPVEQSSAVPSFLRSVGKPAEPSDRSAEPSDKAEKPSDKALESPDKGSVVTPIVQPEANSSGSSTPPLQGGTEVTEIILDEVPLYKQALKSINEEDYGRAVFYLKDLNAQLAEEGYEPYLAECTYLEAGCHQLLNRMNAAVDTYRKAFELFEKFDAQNPLKNKAWHQYSELKKLKAQEGVQQVSLQAGIDQTKLLAGIQKKHVPLVSQRGRFAIDPDALLVVNDNNRGALLEVNDRTVLPKIVKECFSEMSCLETAEIGSNVTNAEDRWFPLMVQGKSAAFSMNGSGHPTFRANVNGRSYLFDVILPDLASGIRKVLLVTNKEKICAVDVDSFDTWLLRMQRANDGRVTTARWYKLEHKKNHAPFVSPVAKPNDIKNPASIRRW